MERIRYLPNPMEALMESTQLVSVAIRLAVQQQLRISSEGATKYRSNADRKKEMDARERDALGFLLSNPDPVERALKTVAGGFDSAQQKSEPYSTIIGAKIDSAGIYAAYLETVDQAQEFFLGTASGRAADNLGYMSVPPDIWDSKVNKTQLHSVEDVDRFSADNQLSSRNRTSEQISESVNSAFTTELLPQWLPETSDDLISRFADKTAAYLSNKTNLTVYEAVIAALGFDTLAHRLDIKDPQAGLKLALVGARIIPALSDDPNFVKAAKLKHLETLIVLAPQYLVGAKRFFKTGNPDDFFNKF